RRMSGAGWSHDDKRASSARSAGSAPGSITDRWHRGSGRLRDRRVLDAGSVLPLVPGRLSFLGRRPPWLLRSAHAALPRWWRLGIPHPAAARSRHSHVSARRFSRRADPAGHPFALRLGPARGGAGSTDPAQARLFERSVFHRTNDRVLRNLDNAVANVEP